MQQHQQKACVTQIEVPSPSDTDPKECNTWVQVDIPDKVVKHLLTQNQKHFGQAAETPFTVHPLRTHLVFDGQGDEAAEEVLHGIYRYEGSDPNVETLMKYIRQIARAQTMTLQPTITEKEIIGKLKVWRELTTTLPSGLHLGHYKALVSWHRYSKQPEDEDKDHQQNRDKWNQMQQEL